MNMLNLGYVVIGLMLLSCLLALSSVWQKGGHRTAQSSLWMRLRDLPLVVVGVAPELIRRCPLSDQVWYAALGWAMLAIATLAAIGMGLSVYQFTEKSPVAVVAALFWGLLILVVDRLMVVAIDKFEAAWKSWLKALPRLVMVIALSFVVSHTIIQWMFAADIARELVKMNREIEDTLNRDDRQRQAGLQRRAVEINEQVKPIDAEISGFNVKLPQEVAGEVGSGKRGDGAAAAALREALQQARERKDALLAERAALETEVKGLDRQVAANNKAHQGVLGAAAGLLDRARAVERLTAQNQQARLLNWALMLGLLLVESIPLLAKLLSRPSRYDEMLQQHYQHNQVVRTLRELIFARFLKGDFSETDYQSPLLKDFWSEIERALRSELTITREQEAVANPESTVTIYLSEPGVQDEEQRLFVNFGLHKNDVLGAHLFKAVEKTAALHDPGNTDWLTQGRFKVLNAQGQPVNLRQQLFAQLSDGIAYVVPVR